MAAPPKKPAPKVRMRYDDADMTKPNPNGLFNDQGFMDRVPGKATSYTAAPAVVGPDAEAAARKAAQAKLVAQGNADRARLAARVPQSGRAARVAPFGATPMPAPPRVGIAVAITRKRKK